MKTNTQLLHEAHEARHTLNLVMDEIITTLHKGRQSASTTQVLDFIQNLPKLDSCFMDFTITYQGDSSYLQQSAHAITISLSPSWKRNTKLEEMLPPTKPRLCFDYIHKEEVFATLVLGALQERKLTLLNIVPPQGSSTGITDRAFNCIAHTFLDAINHSRIPIPFTIHTENAPLGPKVYVRGNQIQLKPDAVGVFTLTYAHVLEELGLTKKDCYTFDVSIRDAFDEITSYALTSEDCMLFPDRTDSLILLFPDRTDSLILTPRFNQYEYVASHMAKSIEREIDSEILGRLGREETL